MNVDPVIILQAAAPMLTGIGGYALSSVLNKKQVTEHQTKIDILVEKVLVLELTRASTKSLQEMVEARFADLATIIDKHYTLFNKEIVNINRDILQLYRERGGGGKNYLENDK